MRLGLGLGLSLERGGKADPPSPFDDGFFSFYTGSPPVNPDDPAAGTLLATGNIPHRAFYAPDRSNNRAKHGSWQATAIAAGTVGCLLIRSPDNLTRDWTTVVLGPNAGQVVVIDHTDILVGDVITILTLILSSSSFVGNIAERATATDGQMAIFVTGSAITEAASAADSATASISTGAVAGVVARADTTKVGGVVQVLSGSTLVASITVNPTTGAYSLPGLAPGTYNLRLMAAFTDCLGPSEPDYHTVTVSAGATTTQNFVTQLGDYTDDFQSYTTSQLLGGVSVAAGGSAHNPIQAGEFWFGTNHDLAGTVLSGPAAPATVAAMDATGGPAGDKAAKYNWLANPAGACTVETNVELGPRIKPAPAYSTLWLRFTSKESANFEHGRNGCSNPSYKFFLIQFDKPTTGNFDGRFGTYLFDDPAQLGQPLPTGVYMDMSDANGHGAASPSADKIGDTWGGTYHTWVMGITGIGTGSCSFSLYLDGVLIRTLTCPITLTAGNTVTFSMGANINNGPTDAQSRWWRELGVYQARPSLLPLV